MITQRQLKEQLHYEEETGRFTWIINRGPARKGAEAGDVHVTRGKNYRRIGVLGYRPKAHRLAFLYVTGSFPDGEVDHEDGDGLNNRWSNLRAVTHAENGKNIRLQINNVSGAAGVCWRKRVKKWQARINANGARKHIGYFTNKEDAIAARKLAEIEFGYHPNHGKNRPL